MLARYDVPQQLAALTDAVQRAYSQYGELATLREPLKYSFRLTLTAGAAAGDAVGDLPCDPVRRSASRDRCRT